MAIKCLTKHEQKYVRYFFFNKKQTVTALSVMFHVSRRTIKRVIDETADE